VCHSLADAHARGLVHRDVTPANIYACRMGLEYDFVKVLDFGLVKFNDPSAMQTTLMTGPHVTTGTPAFMAPEIITNEGEVDQRADVYALGCVAYYLLTGQLVLMSKARSSTFARSFPRLHGEALPSRFELRTKSRRLDVFGPVNNTVQHSVAPSRHRVACRTSSVRRASIAFDRGQDRARNSSNSLSISCDPDRAFATRFRGSTRFRNRNQPLLKPSTDGFMTPLHARSRARSLLACAAIAARR
jgi:serine/threonine protein kinase